MLIVHVRRVIHFAVLFTSPCYSLRRAICFSHHVVRKQMPTDYATLASRFFGETSGKGSCGAGSGGWRFQPSAPDDDMELVFGNATALPRTQEQVGTFLGSECSNPLNFDILRGTGMALPSVNPNPLSVG